MSKSHFGYIWVGCWDERGASTVQETRATLPDDDIAKLPDLSAASPQWVNVLRTQMLEENVAAPIKLQWSLHADTNKKAGTTFLAFSAITGDVSNAKEWIDTKEGRLWRTGAISFAMVSVKIE